MWKHFYSSYFNIMFDSSIKYLLLLLLSSINKEINYFYEVNLVIWLVCNGGGRPCINSLLNTFFSGASQDWSWQN